MSPSSGCPMELSPQQLILVVEGKTEHVAQFIQWEELSARIRWVTTGEEELIQDTSRIKEIPSTREKRTFDGHVKNDKEAKESPSTVVSSSSSPAHGTMFSPDTPDEQVPAVTPDGPVSSNSEFAPDVPTSSNEAVAQVLATAEEDIRIKQEGAAAVLSPEESKRRHKSLRHWIKMNTDPQTGEGRYVFRRGCHERCLTYIFGGSSTDPFPIVRNPPVNEHTGNPNQFIQPNEVFVAGNEAFNSFGPRYPGDKGLVNVEAFHLAPHQEEFHLFVECSSQATARHWHGRDARGGKLYCGVYRKQFPNEELETIVSYDSLGPHIQEEIAKFASRRNWYEKEAVAQFHDDARKDLGEANWAKLTKGQKEAAATQQLMLAEEWSMTTIPVEFVRYVMCCAKVSICDASYLILALSMLHQHRYDEELYRALVDSGCMISRKGQSGRVSIEAETLGQYY